MWIVRTFCQQSVYRYISRYERVNLGNRTEDMNAKCLCTTNVTGLLLASLVAIFTEHYSWKGT